MAGIACTGSVLSHEYTCGPSATSETKSPDSSGGRILDLAAKRARAAYAADVAGPCRSGAGRGSGNVMADTSARVAHARHRFVQYRRSAPAGDVAVVPLRGNLYLSAAITRGSRGGPFSTAVDDVPYQGASGVSVRESTP